MSFINKKTLIPISILAIAAGYFAAEIMMPQKPPTALTVEAPKSPSIISYIAPRASYIRPTVSGNYLVGQFAQNQKDWKTASQYIGKILENDKSKATKELKSHSMVLAMSAGKPDIAIQKANELLNGDEEEQANVLATLFVVVDHFKNERYELVNEALNKIQNDSMAAFIVPVLNIWTGAVADKIDVSKLPPTNIYVYHAMLAGLYTDQKEAVLPYVKGAFTFGDVDVRDAEKFADLFYLYNEAETTKKIFDELKKKNLINDRIEQKIKKLENEETIEQSNFRFKKIEKPSDGAAVVFMNMAEILEREFSDDSANVFARMALAVNPEFIKPRQIIARVYARAERHDDAIEILKTIPEEFSEYDVVQRDIAALHVEKDDEDEAISILKSMKGNIEATIQMGDIYRYEEDFDRAVQTYTKAINQFDDLPDQYWHLLYARGMSYERLGKFEKAEKDLQDALVFRPDEPYLLNYLGYSWADQGVNLDKSLELIYRASELRPDDGYIADSLGWVYYKLEDYEKAVEYLEKAVELLPYDSTVNDHLGDAYWRVGRIKEAKFQWERALNHQEEEDLELTTKLEKKIRKGLQDDDDELSEIPVKSAPDNQDI